MPFGFGRKSLEEQLSDDGCRAQAEVLSSEPTKHHVASYGHELNGRSWILRVRVQPPGEQPFEVELRASLKVMCMPRVGDRIDVLFDPGDHARTVVDPAQDLAPRLHSHSAFRSWVSLPEGEKAIAEARTAAPEHRAELERFAQFYARGALSDDEYKELRRRVLGLGEPAVVATSFQTRSGKTIVISRQVEGVAGDPGASPVDPLEEIARLARLRDGGALSDAEFQARKRALLGDT